MSELVLIANAGDGTVSTLRLADGHLTPLATSPVGEGVGTLAVDPNRDLVYAAVKPEGDAPAAVVTLRLDRVSGELAEVGRRPVDDALAYVALTPDRRVLLGASYHGGFGATWPVDDDGTVGEPVGRVDHPNVHCAVTDGQVAYFVSLGGDLVDQQRLGADGTLEPLGTVALPDGCGPRHLIVDGENAYLITEYSGEVFHLTRAADGRLTRRDPVSIVDPDAGLRHSRMGADPKAEGLIWGADVHRAGDFLLASERTASTLATVAIEEGGSLSRPLAYAPTPEQPRGFGVAGDGRHAIVVGEQATDAQLYAVEADGTLNAIELVGVGKGANWVCVVAE
ncbi:beta-propeller fold lactonase family protein [Mariniluteicoccus endophyticus]